MRDDSSSFALSTANLSLEDGFPKNPPDGLATGDVCFAKDFRLLLLRNTPVFRTTCPRRLVDSSMLLIPSDHKLHSWSIGKLLTPLHLLECIFNRPDLVIISERWGLDLQVDSRRHRPRLVFTLLVTLTISSDQQV